MSCQPAKALLGQRGDQRAPILEVALGRRVRDARAAGHLAQGERRDAALLDEVESSLDERLAQIPMVVGLLARHALLHNTIMLTAATWLASNVSSVNIGAVRSPT
jgi:hypothetical protein